MGCSNSKENSHRISYITPKLVSYKDGSYWAIGLDKKTDRMWYCYCNQFNDIQYGYPILVTELKRNESIVIVIKFNCFVEKVFTFARLKSGKIMATGHNDVHFTDRTDTLFIKQGSFMFDNLESFFNSS
jgi:hypothetical protein